MERVAVIGNCGSGKTTLSLRLGERTGLPVWHLDSFYYGENWGRVPYPAFLKKHQDLIAGDRWILDGNYDATMYERLLRADTVIFLDPPRFICFLRVLRRKCKEKHLFRDARKNLGFLKYVWRSHKQKRENIRNRKRMLPEKNWIVLKSKREAENFLNGLEKPRTPSDPQKN